MLAMKIISKDLYLFITLICVGFILSEADTSCHPRWLPGSKSRIHVNFVPLKKSVSRWEKRPLLDFQSMMIKLPEDFKEIMACDIDQKTKIQVRLVF